jgi:hypothetical protein
MYGVVALLFLLIVAFLGRRRITERAKEIANDIEYAKKYRATLHDYAQSGGDNLDAYEWLVFNSNKIQNQLGPFGVYLSYEPPFSGVRYKNYPAVINLVPDLRDRLSRRTLAPSTYQSLTALDDCFLRYMGFMDEQQQSMGMYRTKPLHWFAEGMEKVLGAPLYLLSAFGVVGQQTIRSLTGSRLFRAVGVVLAVLSAVVGIVTGAEAFITIIRRALGI